MTVRTVIAVDLPVTTRRRLNEASGQPTIFNGMTTPTPDLPYDIVGGVRWTRRSR